MSKSNVYTRTGDGGLTSLATGQREPKASPRLEAYGTADELMSWLGVIASSPSCPPELAGWLTAIQNKLFNIGAYLASEGETPDSTVNLFGFSPEDISKMEENIDYMDSQLPTLHAFILPGGSELAAKTHVARTVCRRAERRLLELNRVAEVNPDVIRYFNRLSDFLFVAAKFINAKAGIPEVTWNKDA